MSRTGWTIWNSCCRIGTKGNAFMSKGGKHAGGCAICQHDTFPGGWTVQTGCLIADACYKDGAKDSTGCGSCAPAASRHAWTPSGGGCLVMGACLTDGKKHTTGCLACDTASGQDRLVVPAGLAATKEGFEGSAPKGWKLVGSDPKVNWAMTQQRAAAGKGSLGYVASGGKDYASAGGIPNSGTAAMPPITLTAGKKAALSFMLYLDVERDQNFDKLWVTVNGVKAWSRSQTTPALTWTNLILDLSAHAGKKVTITFHFDTVDHNANTGEGLYIDEVTVVPGC